MDADFPGAENDGLEPSNRLSSPVADCATCGRPLVLRGEQRACVHCLVNFAAFDDEVSAEPERTTAKRYGQFELLFNADGSAAELGRGAMGTTYRAHDTVLHRAVALKVIGVALAKNPEARERFLREARAAAQFQHPNVAAVSQYGEQGGECFYAMELVEGETLEERISREGPLPVGETLEIASQVARALAAAETRGIIHRDLKPTNLMLARPDAASGERTPSVKVIDFGLAKAISVAADGFNANGTRGFLGTPSFASPEQFGASDEVRVDHRSDIYALGATIWFALTGRAPFIGTTLDEIHSRQHDPLPVEQLTARNVPRSVVKALTAMLSEDPANRPQSARELLETLQRCQSEVTTSPARLRGRARFLTVAGAIFIVCVVATAIWWKHRPIPLKPQDRSIAVLPFENLSAKPADAFYATALQDEITADLARVAALKVISAQSAGEYPPGKRDFAKIGSDLGVRFLLEAGVKRGENDIAVTLRLIDTAGVGHPWLRTYDRQPTDVFLLQGQITREIADRLQTQLSDQEKAAIDVPPTTDLVAYDLYLRASDGPQLVSGPDETRAEGNRVLGLLNQAVARDPNFVRAYCDMAKLQDMLYLSHVDVTPADRALDRRALAESALEKARRVRPDAGEVHLATASHLLMVANDPEQAQLEIEAARRTLPNDPEVEQYAGLLAERSGRLDDAARAYSHAAALDPRNPVPLNMLAVVYRRLRRYAEEDDALARLLTLRQGRYAVATEIDRAMIALESRADLAPLRAVLASPRAAEGPPSVNLYRFLLAYFDRNPDALGRALATAPQQKFEIFGSVYPNAWFEALGARLRGDDARARTAFMAARPVVEQALHDDPSNLNAPMLSMLALIDVGLGRREDALREAQQACAMLPPNVSPQGATTVNAYLALVHAWTGERDLALKQLEACLKEPAAHHVPYLVTYGDLKLNPMWDALRDDPRFTALVARLAPVDAPKSHGR